MSEIVVRVEVRVKAGDRDAFEQAARATAEAVNRLDAETLAWNLYCDESLAEDRGGTAVLVERFASPAGQLAHLGNVGAIAAPMLEIGDFRPMQVHGALPDEHRAQLEQHIGSCYGPVLFAGSQRDGRD
jgi:quinol monooxygenase YgiN